jgi:hypothetical protein
MKHTPFSLLFLIFFCACQKEKNYYMDLGKEKMREYIVPDNIIKFSFLAFDKSKIVLQTSDTSSSKLLLDTKTGHISKADFKHLGMKGYLNTEFRVDTLNQRFWQNKNGEIELYDVTKKCFSYFKSSPILDAIFTKKYAIFSTRKGLRIFDNQGFKLDSISEIPDWEFEIEYASDESIFINSDQLFNFKTKIITPLSREQVRARLDNCIYSESKFRRKLEKNQYEKAWDSAFRKYAIGSSFYFEDIKNVYILYKGKIVILNKLHLGKDSENKDVAVHNHKKDSINAKKLSNFIDFQRQLEENTPNNILGKYKVYQICSKANKERFGNTYQYVNNPFDLEYGISDEQLIDLEQITKQKKYPKAYESNIYTILFDKYTSLFEFDKAMKYYKMWEKQYAKDSIFYYADDLIYVSKIQNKLDNLIRKKVSNDVVLYEKIQLLRKEDFCGLANRSFKEYEWKICNKILYHYPNSIYADDIELGIFEGEISAEEIYYRRYYKKDISKLKKIIAKYPNSNLKKEFELTLITTYQCLEEDEKSDSLEIFNYNLKGINMLVDFYTRNPTFLRKGKEKSDDFGNKLSWAKEALNNFLFEKNIRFILSSSKQEYNKNEPIIITLTIENISKNKMIFDFYGDNFAENAPLYYSALEHEEEGCALGEKLYFQRLISRSPNHSKIEIEGGRSISASVDITKKINGYHKNFTTFENPLLYCHFPNNYGSLQILSVQTLELQYLKRYEKSSNVLKIKIN